jgi:hypothetical protein
MGFESGFDPGLGGVIRVAAVREVSVPLDHVADRHRGKPPSESKKGIVVRRLRLGSDRIAQN